jgi:translation initiation factor 4G
MTKPKPFPLKLIEITKAVELAQPTPGLQALKTARFLEVKNDTIKYPEGIKSPNSAPNNGTNRYDNNFLLQFREVFKEKPSVDWDRTMKDTVGDGTDSARSSTILQ